MHPNFPRAADARCLDQAVKVKTYLHHGITIAQNRQSVVRAKAVAFICLTRLIACTSHLKTAGKYWIKFFVRWQRRSGTMALSAIRAIWEYSYLAGCVGGLAFIINLLSIQDLLTPEIGDAKPFLPIM